MALTVGTDSYISTTDADTYCTDYGIDLLDPVYAEANLRQATLAVDRLYGSRFIGTRTSSTQSLQWPRTVDPEVDAFGNDRDFTEIPLEVEQAAVELAVAMQAGLNPYAQPDTALSKKTIEVDVIKIQSEAASGSVVRADPLYKVSTILSPIIQSSLTLRLVRG